MRELPRRPVGTAGLQLSELGFGAATLGNLYRVVPDELARRTLERALQAGVSYVDTAPYYGLGLSERRVGDILRGHDGIVVSTKVGRLLQPAPLQPGERQREGFVAPLPFLPVYDYTYDAIMRSWELSLQRLGLAAVDILLVHDIGTATHGAANVAFLEQLTDGGLRALEELRGGGAIRAFGLGINEWQIGVELMRHTRLDLILLAGRYTLLDHEAALRHLMPVCEREHVALVLGGVFNSGILATGTRTGAPVYFDYAPAEARIIERTRRIEAVCEAHGIPLRAAALQFALGGPAVASVILGLADEEQVEQALAAYHHPISPDFWTDLQSRGLLAAGAAPPPRV